MKIEITLYGVTDNISSLDKKLDHFLELVVSMFKDLVGIKIKDVKIIKKEN